ncbi:hypothetical protein QBK99_25665 [Corticibacterium sp. UT-5YL-CI-8]|nr:hypothetical protein [Tianweitania sp. UT-5YL-CI-8]
MTPNHLGTFTGHNYRRPEPVVSGWQAFAASLALTMFIGGGLMWLAALVER